MESLRSPYSRALCTTIHTITGADNSNLRREFMYLVELPFDISIQIDIRRKVEFVSGDQFKREKSKLKEIGFAPSQNNIKTTSGNKHWFTKSEDGLVAVKIGEGEALHEVEIRREVQEVLELFESMDEKFGGFRTKEWYLHHDFRKTTSEIELTSRMLSELSLLLSVLVRINNNAIDAEKYSNFVDINDEGISIKQKVITHLISGGSISLFDAKKQLNELRSNDDI